MAPHSQVQISSNILETEKTLQDQLPEGSTTTTLSSWIQIIQASIQFLNSTSPMNVTHCFLCASLQRPLLAAVPVNLSKPTLTSIRDTPTCYSHCPLYLSGNLSQTNTHFPFVLVTSLNIPPSRRDYMASAALIAQIFPPSGLSFWCNGTLYAGVNSTIRVPAFWW
jgi:hypothetical protein